MELAEADEDIDEDIDEEGTGTATFGATLSPFIAETRPAMGDDLDADASLDGSLPDSGSCPDSCPGVESGPVPISGSGPSWVKDIIRKRTISNPIRGMGARDISRCPIKPIW